MIRDELALISFLCLSLDGLPWAFCCGWASQTGCPLFALTTNVSPFVFIDPPKASGGIMFQIILKTVVSLCDLETMVM